MIDFLDFLSSDIMTLELVVWCIYFGLVIAGVMSVYYKRYLGKLVRKLLKKEAFSPDKALSLEQLKLDKHFLIKRAIVHSPVYKSIVYEKNDEVVIQNGSALPIYRQKVDFSAAKFYIPYELRIRAAMKFEKKGSSIVLVAFSSVFFFIVALLVTSYMDVIIEFVKGILS